MTDTSRTLFADGLLDASVTHGVVRMTLAQTGGDGKPVPAGQLVVPLTQLPALANALLGLLRQVEARVKETQAAQGGGASAGAARPAGAAPNGSGAATAEDPATPPVIPGAFRFDGSG